MRVQDEKDNRVQDKKNVNTGNDQKDEKNESIG